MTTSLTWFFLLLAILLEVAGTTSMKLSNGFHCLEPSVFIFVFYLLSFICLAITLKYFEISFAYAVWSGFGTLLIVIIGICFFHESITWIKVLSLTCIICGVIGLQRA